MATKSPDVTKPLLLAVVLCILGGTAYWLEYGKKPKEQRAESEAKKVFVIGKGAVARLEFAGVSMKPELSAKPPLAISLTCESLKDQLCKPEDASKWQMATPLRTKADDATVNSLLKNFGNLVSSESIDLTTETPAKRAQLLKDYGLDAAARGNPATRRVTVVIEGAKKLSAYFGEKHPIGDNVFALLETDGAANENRVYVVPAWQLSVFDQKTSYFRDKNLFGLSEKDISAFTLAVSQKISGKLEGARTADGKAWALRLGAKEFEGDPDVIEALLSAVVHSAAKDVLAEKHEEPSAQAALAGAKNTYDLKFTAKGTDHRIRLYEKKKAPKAPASVYAVIEGQDPVYEIDVYAAEKLEKTMDELRIGKMIPSVDRYSVMTIDIDSHGAESFKQQVVKGAGGEWKIGSNETSRGKVENILDRLSGKTIIAYTGPAPTGENLRLTLRKSADKKGEPVADLEFWSAKGHLYARNVQTKKKEIVELAPDFNALLPWKAAALLDAPGGPKK